MWFDKLTTNGYVSIVIWYNVDEEGSFEKQSQDYYLLA